MLTAIITRILTDIFIQSNSFEMFIRAIIIDILHHCDIEITRPRSENCPIRRKADFELAAKSTDRPRHHQNRQQKYLSLFFILQLVSQTFLLNFAVRLSF